MDLDTLRKEIEVVNDEIIVLLGKRKALTLKVAEVKKREQLPIFDPSREESQKEAIAKKSEENNLNPKVIMALFDDFVAYCRQEMENHWESSH